MEVAVVLAVVLVETFLLNLVLVMEHQVKELTVELV
jgi:hypothetical protein